MGHSFISIPQNQWDDDVCVNLSASERLLYRSKLLGSDLTITNFGGGNTSAKIKSKDPITGKTETMLWVKRSGCDLKSMEMDDFAVLYQSKIEALKNHYRGLIHEAEMVGMLRYCFQKADFKAPSIETFTHAYIPFKHVDHLHSDSIISIATSANGEKLTKKIFKDEIGWIAWQRPGFDFALNLQKLIEAKPNIKGVVWQFHGLITWANTAKDCYFNSVEAIAKAANYINTKVKPNSFGVQKFDSAQPNERKKVAAALMPRLRYLLSELNHKIGIFTDTDDVLEFANAENAFYFCNLGTSCPDHFLRTKIKPLYFRADVKLLANSETLARLKKNIDHYVEDYTTYYKRNKDVDSPAIRDPYPAIILIPGLGMFSFGQNKREARISGEFYVNAIHVMKGAESIGKYQALNEKEAFDIEYWSLEEDKLKRLPKEKGLSRKIAMIIGLNNPEITLKMISEDACTCATQSPNTIFKEFSTSERHLFFKSKSSDSSELSAFARECTIQFGGIDVFVLNSKQIFTVDLKSYIISDLILNAITFLKNQKLGGSIILVHHDQEPDKNFNNFIKNSLIVLAQRFKTDDIRINLIWVGQAESKKQNRKDIADSTYFFASDLSLNCTGSIIYIN